MTAEMALSKLCNKYDIKHKSGDTPEDMMNMLSKKFDGMKGDSKPMALSEDHSAMVKENREMRIDLALSENKITPAQAKLLKQKFSDDSLELSEGAATDTALVDAIEVCALSEKKDFGKEKTGEQLRDLELAEEDQADDTPNALQRLADRQIKSSLQAAN